MLHRAWLSEDHPYQDNQIYALAKVGVVLGVENHSNPITQLVGAYPNPVSGQSVQNRYQPEPPDKRASISLYNLAGQLVHNEKLSALAIGMNQLKVDVSQLQAGVYFYSLVIDGFKETRKLWCNSYPVVLSQKKPLLSAFLYSCQGKPILQ